MSTQTDPKNILEKKIKNLETGLNNDSVSLADIEEKYKWFLNIAKYKGFNEDEINQYKLKFEGLKEIAKQQQKFSKITSKTLENIVAEGIKEVEIDEPKASKEIQKLSDVSPRSIKLNSKKVDKIKKNKGYIIATAAIIGAGILVGVSLTSCGKKKIGDSDKSLVNEVQVIEETTPNEIEKVVPAQPKVAKIIDENLSFDPNNNEDLVARMSKFIVNALNSGIPVKDVMTEEELRLADEKEQSLVTIEQLMDYYMVMNIEDINPIDYARLQYSTKTAETITDNYLYCSRLFKEDTLTANNDTIINYKEIIADKDSSESVQKFVDFLAKYNTEINNQKVIGKEIKEYIISNYITRDANIYSMAANEFVYRLMYVADDMSNNSILSNDVNVILNEDGKISCESTKNDDGIKGKTERAEEFTSIYNTVDEKLKISLNFYNQDLTNIEKSELKTGLELEKEIKENVLSMAAKYNVNPKFTISESAKSIKPKVTKESEQGYITIGNNINIANEELSKYGINPADKDAKAKYEQAKKTEFEQKAKNDSGHTIDINGNVVATGSAADKDMFNNGYNAGYDDGNNGRSRNPNSDNSTYCAGYNSGYDLGKSDKERLDESYSHNEETTHEDVPDKVISNSVETSEQTFTNEVAPIVEPTQNVVEPEPTQNVVEPEPTQNVVEPEPTQSNTVITETIEPVNNGVSETTESITIEDFVEPVGEQIQEEPVVIIEEQSFTTSSLEKLRMMKKELYNISEIYNEENYKGNTKA